MSEAVLDVPRVRESAGELAPLPQLVLVRLLAAAKTQPGLAEVGNTVGGLLPRKPNSQAVKDAAAELRERGLLAEGKRLALTNAGRMRAMAVLGVDELPARCDWRKLKKFLLAKSLGLSASSEKDAKVLGDSEKIAALLLRQKFDLPTTIPLNLTAVLDAIVCRKLGVEGVFDFQTLRTQTLLGAAERSPAQTLKKLKGAAPAVLLQPPSGQGKYQKLALSNLFKGEMPAPAGEPEDEPFDLETFSNTVVSAARDCPTGRFGDNKVFISHVWRQLEGEPRLAPLGLAGFKAKLVEANERRLLTLSRADLVHLFDAADLQQSETRWLNATYHFVTLEGK